MQHRRPEQRVEIDDVLADEVNLFGVRTRELFGEVQTVLGAVGLEAGQIADRGVEPDVEVLARRVGNFNAEVGRVAGDVPVGQVAVEPFLVLGQNLGLHAGLAVGALARRPLVQELLRTRVGEAEEVVRARLQNRHGAGNGAARIDEVRGRVHAAALFARVAVLIGRAALGARALDEAVGQEHADLFVVELLDVGRVNQARGLQAPVDVLRELGVFRAFGAVPVVKVNVEVVQILAAAGRDLRDEFLRRDALLSGRDHDRGAVSVVSAHKVHGVAAHALVAPRS